MVAKDNEAAEMQICLECGESVFTVIFERNNGFCTPCRKLVRQRELEASRACKDDKKNTDKL